MIKKIKLNNNTEIPSIGLGTWQLNGSECIHAVKQALNLGYRHIDTAEMYLNESEIGTALKSLSDQIPRDQLFITSKISPTDLDYYKVLGACEESLARLETHYLDLYLIHWPQKNMNLQEVLKAMKQLYDKGKIKAFGVSNFTIHHLKDTLKIAKELGLPIVTNQVEFHPFLYQKELLDFCNQHDITITAYSPLARGKILDDPTLNELAQKHKKTPCQICLKWMLQKNIIVIPKASRESHLKENINLNDFQLDDEDMERIDNITHKERIINPAFAEFDY